MTQIKPWIEISRETVLQKYGRKIDKVIFELPDGSKSDYYIAGQKSDCETTEVILMGLGDFKKHLKSGQISDIATGYFGLEHLGLIG